MHIPYSTRWRSINLAPVVFWHFSNTLLLNTMKCFPYEFVNNASKKDPRKSWIHCEPRQRLHHKPLVMQSSHPSQRMIYQRPFRHHTGLHTGNNQMFFRIYPVNQNLHLCQQADFYNRVPFLTWFEMKQMIYNMPPERLSLRQPECSIAQILTDSPIFASHRSYISTSRLYCFWISCHIRFFVQKLVQKRWKPFAWTRWSKMI